MNSFDNIMNDLRHLGIEEGDMLLVHSSYKALGQVEGGIETFLKALLHTLGKEGTLFLPALSYATVHKNQPVFDVRNTPCCIGAIPEFFRNMPGVKRSVNPTHSVCGTGKHAEEILSQHILDATPCGGHSAFRAIPKYKGKLLFAGCGLRPNTSMHAIEELVRPWYLFQDTPVEYDCIDENGRHHAVTCARHDFEGGTLLQRYDRVLHILSPRDYKTGKILDADCYLLDAEALWEKAERQYRMQPDYFVERP